MPFDGFVTKCVSEELAIILAGGRIEKVQQPERDEIHLIIRNNGRNYRLLISANATASRIHLAGAGKENPGKAPMFCMILRKHLSGGRILGICAGGLERAVEMTVESASELGDISKKTLIAELMGKHSNIILLNERRTIIDSLVHVDRDMSVVREIMPAREYVPPPSQGKLVPESAAAAGDIINAISSLLDGQPMKKISAALLETIMGASPLFCREVCRKAGVDEASPLALIGPAELEGIGAALADVLGKAFGEKYSPCIILRNQPAVGDARDIFDEPDAERSFLDYYCWKVFGIGAGLRLYDTMCEAVDEFYAKKTAAASLAQRKSGLLKLVNGNASRCRKKLAIQRESVAEAAGGDIYRLYGELITANIHEIRQGETSVRLLNHYAGEESGDSFVDIKLSGELSPQANAQQYFKKYRKAANTRKHALIQAEETEGELAYLESVLLELENAQTGQDIDEIRRELTSQKYIADRRANVKSRNQKAAGEAKSQPHSFLSSDGLTILVGKNNGQNDRLTLKIASPNDVWLHARGVPGSHALIRRQGAEIPDRTLIEAASLAAYFSRARMSGNVEVDYTAARHVRKPSGAKPGMVIYDNQRTLVVKSDAALPSRLASPPGPAQTQSKPGDSGRPNDPSN